MQLTPHFGLDELTHSATATRLGIQNAPTDSNLANLNILAGKLEMVRSILGRPMIISSGYRCPELNARVGGSQTSAHCQGLAADFTAPQFGIPSEICRALLAHAEELQWDQLIFEGTWVHLGFTADSNDARGEVLTATFSVGKATYTRGIIG